MRHLCHLQSPGDGRLSAMPGGEQEGSLRPTGLRGCLGRVQPLVPLLLHVALGQTEQSLPAVPAGVVYPTNGKVILMARCSRSRLSCRRHRRSSSSSRKLCILSVGLWIRFSKASDGTW